ncbi:metallopeptidase family protein [Qipengyuania sediminis]|uniref:metallopeptidase family protein n=1 Tax=Qipengyuania sediminis TaxID=1532023 RepID=UPI00105956B4|nr:metallopeptidase family protein [Qipengyuania sediminis]
MIRTLSLEDMEAMARGVLAGLPEPFRAPCAEIVLRAEDFATPAQLAGVGLFDRWELTGLYEGVPLPERTGGGDSGEMPPRIWLFRMPILAEMRSTRVPMEELVRHVVIHEAGHHFGFSDADMHAIENADEG